MKRFFRSTGGKINVSPSNPARESARAGRTSEKLGTDVAAHNARIEPGHDGTAGALPSDPTQRSARASRTSEKPGTDVAAHDAQVEPRDDVTPHVSLFRSVTISSIGVQIVVLAVTGLILLSNGGALSKHWRVTAARTTAVERAATRHARTEHARSERHPREPDWSDGWLITDPAARLFDPDPGPPDDFVCVGETDRTEAMLQDWKPDHDTDSDDWLMALATLMGLAEAWTDEAAGPWNSCQM
jgi:hypothetical protein